MLVVKLVAWYRPYKKSNNRIHEIIPTSTQGWKMIECISILLFTNKLYSYIINLIRKIELYAYLFLTGLSSRNLNITVAFSTAANRTRQSSLYEKMLLSIDIAIFDSKHFSIFYTTASNSSIPVKVLIKYCPKNIWSTRQGYGV